MIRVLVVDDDSEKVNALASVMGQLGPEAVAADVSGDLSHARRFLTGDAYDVLILDLAVPLRDGEAPAPEGGYSLLRELVEGDDLQLPKYVIGLTAFDNLYEKGWQEFADRGWLLLRYVSSDGRWRLSVREILLHAIRVSKEGSERKFHKDVAIITAMQDAELEAVRRLPWGFGDSISMDEHSFYYEGQFSCGEKNVSVVAACAPRMGMVPAALLATKVIERFRPAVLVLTGICAGVKSAVSICDVIFASVTWDWQRGKYVRTDGGSRLLPDIDPFRTSDVVGSRVQRFLDDQSRMARIRGGWSGAKPSTESLIRYGPIPSGASVVADESVVDEILAQNRKTLGFDMECYAVFSAANFSCSPQPTVIVVKGVSDYANSEKNDAHRHLAAYLSAQVAKEYLEQYVGEILAVKNAR